eukprot:2158517-Prymnesium_polylepis.1
MPRGLRHCGARPRGRFGPPRCSSSPGSASGSTWDSARALSLSIPVLYAMQDDPAGAMSRVLVV